MAKDKVTVEIIAEAKKSIKSVKNFAIGIGAAMAAVKGMTAIVKDLLAAYAQQEIAEAKLTSAIIATGKESSISADALFKYASELQDVTTYGDEMTISAMALVQQLSDLNEDGIKKVIPGIQDMASALGVDLEVAASLVGKTLGSSTNALSRYGIQIDMTGTKEEKLAELTEQLNAKFGGLSKDLAATSTGAMKQFKNAFGDLKEVMGESVSKGLEPVARGLTKIVKELVKSKREALDTKAAYQELKELGEGEVLAEESMLLILKDKVKLTERIAASREMFTETANEAAEAARRELQAYEEAIIAQAYWNKQAARYKKEGEERAEKAAKAMAREQKALLDYLKDVEDMYARTEAGQEAALEQSIKYWELQLLSADKTKPKVLAILEMLYEERDAYKEIAEEIENTDNNLKNLVTTTHGLIIGAKKVKAWAAALLAVKKSQKQVNFETSRHAQILRAVDENAGNANGTLISGMIQYRQSLVDAIEKLKEQNEIIEQITYTGITAMASVFADVFVETASGWDAFAAAGKEAIALVLEGLAELAFARAAIEAATLTPKGLLAAAALILAGIAALTAATGVRAMAEGGIVTQPTLALIGEAGPEAVVPLGRGGSGVGGITVIQHVHGSVITERQLYQKAMAYAGKARRGY